MNSSRGLARMAVEISRMGVHARSLCASVLFTLLSLSFVLAERGASAQTSGPAIELEHSVTQQGNAKPWLIVFLFDRSTSMLDPYTEEEIQNANVRTRWDAALEIASRRLSNYQKALGKFELLVYDFDSDPTSWGMPRGQKRLIDSPQSAAEAARSIRLLQRPNGATNLWSSVKNIFDGARRDAIGRNYAGLSLIVMSDGEDGIPGDSPLDVSNRYKGAIGAMKQFRDPLFIDFVAFANLPNNFKQDIGGLGQLSKPNADAAPPVVESLTINPSTLTATELPGKASECVLPLRISGKPLTTEQIRGAKFSLRPNQLGVKLEQDPDLKSIKLVRQSDSVLGGTLVLDCEIARLDAKPGSQPLQASCRIALPASKALPAAADWGLPAPCGGGNRVLVLGQGESLDLSIGAIPAAASATWTVNGQARSTEKSLSIPNLAPGRYDVNVQASLRNDVQSAEITVFVVDPKLSIAMPQRIEAGASAQFTVSHAQPIPDELKASLSDFEWTATSTQPVKGSTLDATYAIRGSARVSVTRELTHCGRTILFQGATDFEVQRGPSLRILTASVTRGVASTLSARVDQADRISSVLFIVTDPSSGSTIDSQKRVVVRDPADPLAGSAELSIEYLGSASTLSVTATPILLDDSGKARDESDPECVKRRQTADVSVRSPEVTLTAAPTPGSEFYFGQQFDVLVQPVGGNSTAVDRVEVTLTSAVPVRVAIVNAQSGWKLPVRAVADMGSTLTIDAKALDKQGQQVSLATPFNPFTLKLMPPVPEIKLTSSLGDTGTIEWSGPNSEPPLLNAKLVIRGTDSAYPLAEQRATVTWSCSDGLKLLASGSTGTETDRATFQIVRSGTHRVEAQLSSSQSSLVQTIEARPRELVVGPELAETLFESDEPVVINHANTKGSWKEAIVRFRIDGLNWNPLPSDGIIDPAPQGDVEAEYEVWYRPWGVAASGEPWTAGSGWVGSRPLRAQLLKPRSWPIFWLAASFGLGMIVAFFLLSKDHRYRWAVIEWNKSPYGHREDKVRGYCGTLPTFRRARYLFLRKVVELELPDVPNEDEYRWTTLARGGKGSACKAFVEWHKDGSYHFVINGQLEDGSVRPGKSAKSIGSTGAGNFQLCVTYPRSIQGTRDTEWLPLYLRIHEHKNTTVRNLVQHWISIFVLGSLIVAGLFTYLALIRVI